jgi:hypothetical protein
VGLVCWYTGLAVNQFSAGSIPAPTANARSGCYCLVMLSRVEAGKLGYAKSSVAMETHRDKMRSEAQARYDSSPKKCLHCSALIPYQARANSYCGSSCFAKHSNPKRPRKNTCPSCGGPKAKRTSTMCRKCKVLQWNAIDVRSAGCDQLRRKILIRDRGLSCEKCHLSEWNDEPIPIEMDHINGDSADNRPENLRLLCPNCHAQTPTFKNHNRGNGRKSRRRRDSTLGSAPTL